MMGMAVRPNLNANVRMATSVQPHFSGVYALTGNAAQLAEATQLLKKEATQAKMPIEFHQGNTVLVGTTVNHEVFVVTGAKDTEEYKLKLKEEQIALALSKKVRENVVSANSKFTKELEVWRDSLFDILTSVFERIKKEGPVNKIAQANASQTSSAAVAKRTANNGLAKKVTLTNAEVKAFSDLLEKYNDLNQGQGTFPTNITSQSLFDRMPATATNLGQVKAKINKGTFDVATGQEK